MPIPELTDAVQCPEAKVLATIMQGLREDMTELKVSVRGMTDSLAALVRLQVEHGETRKALERAFEGQERFEQRFERAHLASVEQRNDLDARLQKIEREMPGLREGRKWLIGIAGVCLVMLLTALVASVLVPRWAPDVSVMKNVR